jgi:S-adenosylmethionine:tRNA ribosyltransferase-isomerase
VRLDELDFAFPEDLIAQRPAEPRDSCRLMYLTADGATRHGTFSDLPDFLCPGDTLVLNDSRVLPARLFARKETGGSVELLFLREVEAARATDYAQERGGSADARGECWEVLARPSHRLRPGETLLLEDGERLELRRLLGEGRWAVQGPPERSMVAVMEARGLLPVPPYIKTYPAEPSSYQTVYASPPGSAAAPTAGLHFTPELLDRLRDAGVRSAYVTLHVGLDTFLPIREKVVEDHRIHRETYCVGGEALRTIRGALAGGDRLVAVGTTATRVLETLARIGALAARDSSGPVAGSTEIFITPGHDFRAVGALLTNFHLPRSSVLALTMAFAGVQRLREAYAEAVAMRYRFFSFGDAMLIDWRDSGGDRGH